jgi:hypothetical protein
MIVCGEVGVLGEQPVKISYPDLFSIARCKNVWVEDHMEGGRGLFFI